jgi:hypothetical protein
MKKMLELKDISFEEKGLNDITLMFLGSARCKPLQHRRDVKNDVMKFGYKDFGYKDIIIMEDIKDEDADKSLDDKFRRITEKFNINFFIAFFHNDFKMDGVAFELGWLCCKYNIIELSKRLRIIYERNYDWENTTAYIPDLFHSVPRVEFDEEKNYSKASQCIHKMILRSI